MKSSQTTELASASIYCNNNGTNYSMFQDMNTLLMPYLEHKMIRIHWDWCRHTHSPTSKRLHF